MSDDINPNPLTSPFGFSGNARDLSPGSTTSRSNDMLGREIITERNLFGGDTREIRDHLGNVIDRRTSFF